MPLIRKYTYSVDGVLRRAGGEEEGFDITFDSSEQLDAPDGRDFVAAMFDVLDLDIAQDSVQVASFSETEDYVDPVQRIREGIEQVREAAKNLTRFEMDNAKVLQELAGRKEALQEAQDELAWAMAEAEVNYVDDPKGELLITYVRSDRGQYDAEKLPPDIRDNPAITKLVADKKQVERAIKRGLMTEAQAEAAYVPNWTKPSIRVKPIEG